METSSTEMLPQETSLPPSENDASLPPTSEANGNVKEERAQAKAMLAEARQTRDMLIAFRSAVESGTYAGAKMRDLAIGLSFVEMLLKNNNQQIHGLQERLGDKGNA